MAESLRDRMSIPDFAAEAAKLAQSARSYSYDSPVLTGSAAVDLARRMFALGMTWAMDLKYADNMTELAIRTEAEVIDKGGKP